MSLLRPHLTLRLILMLLLASLMTACSTVRFVYNQGDTLTYWWLDDHIGFNQEQEPFIRATLERQFWWHRTEELPAISATLDRIHKKAQKPLAKQEVLELRAELTKHGYKIADQLIPDTAKLLSGLQASQIENIQKRINKNNEKYRKEFLPDDKIKQQKIRADKIIERTEWFYGSLNASQENKIREFVAARPIDLELVYRERLRRQNDFISLCKEIQQNKLSPKASEALLKDYIKHFESGRTKDQQIFHRKWVELGAETAAFISQLMSPEQQKYAGDRIASWHADVQELIKDSSVLAAKKSALLNR